MEKLILITNPGSASRKYALYRGEKCLATLHFEYVDDVAVCALSADGEKRMVSLQITDIAQAASECERILRDNQILKSDENINVVAARLVAPSKDFQIDQIVTDEIIAKLEKVQNKAPLHTGVNLSEIKYFREILPPDVPVVAISDSSFHATKPIEAFRYALDTDLQDRLDIGRFGYHGISVSSIVEIMKAEEILPQKLIVCHLGGGASVSAVLDGKGLDTSMGYSPNSGLMMATRTGDIDPSAVFAIQNELGLNDLETEAYLNKKSGFLGMSGKSDDMRIVLADDRAGNQKAIVANKTYRYMLIKTIGAMVAAMNGVDAIVFTATVGERAADLRQPICAGLAYLGFEIDDYKNLNPGSVVAANLAASGSKPIYMIRTDELREMARRTALIIS